MGLGDFEYALKFREMLKSLVSAEVETQRPQLKYATVQSIDRAKRKCTVTYPGSTSQVAVSMGSVQPRDVGQVVRIDGLLGDRFVSDVMGPTYIDSPIIQAPTINGAVSGSHGLATTTYVDSGDSAINTRWSNSAIVTPVELDGVTDLNNVTTTGTYFQSANADAQSAPNYPAGYAGVLEVQNNNSVPGGNTGQIYQRYTIYSQFGYHTYVRGFYTTTGWSAWREIGPGGGLVRVGSNIRTANTTSVTTEYNVCSVTLPNPVNGDTYRVHAGANFSPDTAGMYTALRIKHAAGAVVGGTQIAQIYLDHRAVSRVVGAEVTAEFQYTGTTGAAGYNVVFVAFPGGGGSLCQASATQPAYLYVDKVL